jgi:hypothetical protein
MKLLGAEAVPGGAQKTWLHTGSDGQKQITVETIVDVEPILKRNAEEFASASSSYHGSDMHKVASIPGIVIEQMCKLHKIPFRELMTGKTELAKRVWNEMLNGRDFRAFRTKPGRVGVGNGR